VARTLTLPRPPAALVAGAARFWPLAAAIAGAVALIAAEFLVLREIRAVTAVPAGGLTRGGAHHGYALAVIGAAMLPMAWGAVRGGSRPAAVALVALALAAVAIVLAVDLPALDATGVIGRTYALAEGHPGPGFWLECAGAALALVAATVVLLRERAASRS
jgi:hypothetical protein